MGFLFGEWNFEDCVRVRAREAREEGIEEGLERGMERGIMNLSEFGMPAEQIARALKLPQNKVLQYLGRQ
jgi:predicted transposase YdaD